MSDETAPQTSRRAESSFALGLSSLVLLMFTGVPAIIQGLRGLRDIHCGAGRLKGRGLAFAGMGTGLLGRRTSGEGGFND